METTSEVAEALGESAKPVPIGGRDWFLQELDLNDLVDAERHGVDINAVASGNMEHGRTILWLTLRKSDPDLTDADRDAGNYKITEREAGKLITAKVLRENPDIIHQIMVRSGFITDEPSGNDQAGE